MRRRRRKGRKRGGFGRFFKNIGKGIKKGAEKVGKGIKRGAQEVGKVANVVATGLDAVGAVGGLGGLPSPQQLKQMAKEDKEQNLNFGQKFKKGIFQGMSNTGKQLLAPTRLIKEIDPLKNTGIGKAGFSPLSFAADVALAPVSSVGTVLETFGDDKKRKKLAKGDLDVVADLAFAPVAFVPGIPGAGKVASVATKGLKNVGKRILPKYAQGVIREGVKQAGRVSKTIGL
jgi:hypothetical protein